MSQTITYRRHKKGFCNLAHCSFVRSDIGRGKRLGYGARRAAMRTTQDATSKVPIKRLPPSDRLMKPGSEIKSWEARLNCRFTTRPLNQILRDTKSIWYLLYPLYCVIRAL